MCAGSDRRHIFLTGFMGAGKSSVARVLSERTGRVFVDLDDRVAGAAGMSITEIFATRGEASFREMEHGALEEVVLEQRAVVATGGGAVIREDNRLAMRRHGVIVNLTLSPEEVRKRLAGDETRPLLRGDNSLEKITSLQAEREQWYADADVRVDTTGKSVEAIVEEILVSLKNISSDEVAG